MVDDAPQLNDGGIRRLGNGTSNELIYHLALADEWQGALASGGSYERSTVGKSLAQEGFIHCSFAYQVGQTARRFYSGRNDTVLLTIDRARVRGIVRIEQLDGAPMPFPHLYGPLPVDAVIGARPLSSADIADLDLGR